MVTAAQPMQSVHLTRSRQPAPPQLRRHRCSPQSVTSCRPPGSQPLHPGHSAAPDTGLTTQGAQGPNRSKSLSHLQGPPAASHIPRPPGPEVSRGPAPQARSPSPHATPFTPGCRASSVANTGPASQAVREPVGRGPTRPPIGPRHDRRPTGAPSSRSPKRCPALHRAHRAIPQRPAPRGHYSWPSHAASRRPVACVRGHMTHRATRPAVSAARLHSPATATSSPLPQPDRHQTRRLPATLSAEKLRPDRRNDQKRAPASAEPHNVLAILLAG
ncbi:hypothetical protein NDU88_000685 [Pleurodeles waltl]|uniref:Uncharacterized protein n=1 Tax=Pleurodeles waltl TaxID=8319 RepID=A0AAV7WK74_PLEWA|nr:hypothetical protein NDU88_000685 [Pleurodeles waltl]